MAQVSSDSSPCPIRARLTLSARFPQRLRPQATKIEQDISVETSVQTVKLLIETGIGCITYLRYAPPPRAERRTPGLSPPHRRLMISSMSHGRGLLPDENFEDVRISAPRLGPAPPSDRAPTSSQSDDKKKGIQSVKVKQIARGYSSEADKILDWIVSRRRGTRR